MSDRHSRRHGHSGSKREYYDGRDYHDPPDYYDDRHHYDDYESPARPRLKPTRRPSLGRQVLNKLGSAMGGLGLDQNNSKSHRSRPRSRSRSRSSSRTRHHSRDHSRSRSRSRSSSRTRRHQHSRDHSRDRAAARYYPPSSSRRHHSASPKRPPRSRGRSHTTDSSSSSHPRASSRSSSRWERGIKAAMEAGAAEAFRLRKEPGPWTGAKGGRIATAALSAGVIGGATEARKEEGHSSGKLGSLGSAVGGMVVNRLVNGPRKEVRR